MKLNPPVNVTPKGGALVTFGQYDMVEAKVFLKDAERMAEFEMDSTECEFLNVWRKPDGVIYIEHERRDLPVDEDGYEEYSLTPRLLAGEDTPSTLMSYGKNVLETEPVARVRHSNMVDIQVLENGNMRIVATRDFYEGFNPAEDAKHGEERALNELLENALCNGWACVGSYDMDSSAYAITDEGGSIMDDGEVSFHPHYWSHTNSISEGQIQALYEQGFVHFTKHLAADDLDDDQIREWKQRTNEDYRKNSGDKSAGDLWPLDEPKAPEGLRAAAAAATPVVVAAPVVIVPGVTVSPRIAERMSAGEAPKWQCAIFQVVTPDGQHYRGAIQGSGGKLGAGVAHSKKPTLIAQSAAETLGACINRASEGKPLSDSAFFSVYEPKAGHVQLTIQGTDRETVDIPLVGTQFEIVEV